MSNARVQDMCGNHSCVCQGEWESWQLLQQRLQAAAAGWEAADLRVKHLESLNGSLEADLCAALAERDAVLAVWRETLGCTAPCYPVYDLV